MKTPHELLIDHILKVLKKALEYEYHCFKSLQPCPKVDLYKACMTLAENTMQGKYDNDPDEEDLVDLRTHAENLGFTEDMMKKLGL